ncbi:MAG TPA: YbaB/EbfC family nucleoid-associated protein [Bacillota bacterium]|jgi:hypothetical protein
MGMNLNKMMKQVQKLQQDMARAEEELASRTFEATAGGGVVEVTVNGRHEVTKVTIKPEVVDPEDVEMLQDLILAAVNEALRKADETVKSEMAKLTGGLKMPGML